MMHNFLINGMITDEQFEKLPFDYKLKHIEGINDFKDAANHAIISCENITVDEAVNAFKKDVNPREWYYKIIEPMNHIEMWYR